MGFAVIPLDAVILDQSDKLPYVALHKLGLKSVPKLTWQETPASNEFGIVARLTRWDGMSQACQGHEQDPMCRNCLKRQRLQSHISYTAAVAL